MYKRNHRNHTHIQILMLIFIVALVSLGLYLQYGKMYMNSENNFKNINISFYDHSLQKENPSVKLTIDGEIIYCFDSISESFNQDIIINLQKGKHLVEVSTKIGQYKCLDTINVENYMSEYRLSLFYEYNPPFNEYRKISINDEFQSKLKEKTYSEKQKKTLYRQLTIDFDLEPKEEVFYKECNRHFTVFFKKIIID